MTIASTPTLDLDVNRIILLAYREAGLLNAYMGYTEEQRQAALYFLELVVEGLGAESRFARTVDERNVTLVDGTFEYDMPADCLDVLDSARFIDVSYTDVDKAVEIPVRQIDREAWGGITAKNATGRPTMYYADRSAVPVKVRLWPIPSSTEAGATIKFLIHRLRATVLGGTTAPDFEQYWNKYLVFELAHHLARSSNRSSANDLERIALQTLQRCRGSSNQSTNQTFIVRHRTGWR